MVRKTGDRRRKPGRSTVEEVLREGPPGRETLVFWEIRGFRVAEIVHDYDETKKRPGRPATCETSSPETVLEETSGSGSSRRLGEFGALEEGRFLGPAGGSPTEIGPVPLFPGGVSSASDGIVTPESRARPCRSP